MAGVRATKKAATRAKLIRIGVAAFRKHGYPDVHIRDVAKAAGMSTGSIMGQFKTKALFFEACIGRPAPDVPAFLARIAEALRRAPRGPNTMMLDDLAADAEDLRRDLIGHHA